MSNSRSNFDESKEYRVVYDNQDVFSKETIEALGDLGIVLRKIHRRLLAEGYVISEGRIIKKPDIIEY
ncbi:MAG: hypothetical protein V4469_05120 [Patescibacteria group bacterium]